MAWIVLFLVLGSLLGVLALLVRRRERLAHSAALGERAVARSEGSDRARLQYPHVDLTRCIGCGSCVEACPEDGVLGMVHGQAVVLHGSRCVGHGLCATACPVNAIAITLADITERRDIPALAANFESTRTPGLFLAGEVTGLALVRTAIAHGTAVAAEVARRSRDVESVPSLLDLVIVGAGPAGLACSLEAKRHGLSFVTLEREQVGGAVAQYPRRKLVMTQPVELPLHGKLARTTYAKEELMELWEGVALREELPIRTGESFERVEQLDGGALRVFTQTGSYDARNVCLALGRRGTPRKLGVPGEELPKVAYALLDAQSYTQRRILVVGGGDSAVEAAMGLAEQPGNEVTLSYRQGALSRIKARNALRFAREVDEGRVRVVFQSLVQRITADSVLLEVKGDEGKRQLWLDNDDVFVFAGGTPPFEQLERSGISFDPKDRPSTEPLAEQGSGLVQALVVAAGFGLLAVGWALFERDYYGAEPAVRALADEHRWLRPSSGVGLALGVFASLAILSNLAYLVRRSPRIGLAFGSLKIWMTAHVATGLLAFLAAALHAGFAPGHTVGGHAYWALFALVCTGAIGRYLYAFVPRAANGRELALDEARTELARLASAWDGTNRAFGERVRARVDELVADVSGAASFFARLRALLGSQFALRRALAELVLEGRHAGVAHDELDAITHVARRAHRAALMAAHFADLRALLGSWRWFHRWIALLMVLLVVVHVVTALMYAQLGSGGAP
jgi:thioredoxin reductase/NAD-dependent dihydropyrimidine dehydrogenase PreA subunit